MITRDEMIGTIRALDRRFDAAAEAENIDKSRELRNRSTDRVNQDYDFLRRVSEIVVNDFEAGFVLHHRKLFDWIDRWNSDGDQFAATAASVALLEEMVAHVYRRRLSAAIADPILKGAARVDWNKYAARNINVGGSA